MSNAVAYFSVVRDRIETGTGHYFDCAWLNLTSQTSPLRPSPCPTCQPAKSLDGASSPAVPETALQTSDDPCSWRPDRFSQELQQRLLAHVLSLTSIFFPSCCLAARCSRPDPTQSHRSRMSCIPRALLGDEELKFRMAAMRRGMMQRRPAIGISNAGVLNAGSEGLRMHLCTDMPKYNARGAHSNTPFVVRH